MYSAGRFGVKVSSRKRRGGGQSWWCKGNALDSAVLEDALGLLWICKGQSHLQGLTQFSISDPSTKKKILDINTLYHAKLFTYLLNLLLHYLLC